MISTFEVGCGKCGWSTSTTRTNRLTLWYLNRRFDLHYVRHAWAARNDR